MDRLPKHMLEQPRRQLEELKDNERGYATILDFHVTADGRCWLKPGMLIDDKPNGQYSIEIERRADGYYIRVPSRQYRITSLPVTDFIPVVSVEIASQGPILST